MEFPAVAGHEQTQAPRKVLKEIDEVSATILEEARKLLEKLGQDGYEEFDEEPEEHGDGAGAKPSQAAGNDERPKEATVPRSDEVHEEHEDGAGKDRNRSSDDVDRRKDVTEQSPDEEDADWDDAKLQAALGILLGKRRRSTYEDPVGTPATAAETTPEKPARRRRRLSPCRVKTEEMEASSSSGPSAVKAEKETPIRSGPSAAKAELQAEECAAGSAPPGIRSKPEFSDVVRALAKRISKASFPVLGNVSLPLRPKDQPPVRFKQETEPVASARTDKASLPADTRPDAPPTCIQADVRLKKEPAEEMPASAHQPPFGFHKRDSAAVVGAGHHLAITNICRDDTCQKTAPQVQPKDERPSVGAEAAAVATPILALTWRDAPSTSAAENIRHRGLPAPAMSAAGSSSSVGTFPGDPAINFQPGSRLQNERVTDAIGAQCLSNPVRPRPEPIRDAQVGAASPLERIRAVHATFVAPAQPPDVACATNTIRPVPSRSVRASVAVPVEPTHTANAASAAFAGPSQIAGGAELSGHESAHCVRDATAATAGPCKFERAAAVTPAESCGIERIAKPRPDPVHREFPESSALQSSFVRFTNTPRPEPTRNSHVNFAAPLGQFILEGAVNTAHSELNHVAHAATTPPSEPADVATPASITRCEPGRCARPCMSASVAQSGVARTAITPQVESAYAACASIAAPVAACDVVRAATESRAEPAGAARAASAVAVAETSDLSGAAATTDSQPFHVVRDTQAPPKPACDARAFGPAGELVAQPGATDEPNGDPATKFQPCNSFMSGRVADAVGNPVRPRPEPIRDALLGAASPLERIHVAHAAFVAPSQPCDIAVATNTIRPGPSQTQRAAVAIPVGPSQVAGFASVEPAQPCQISGAAEPPRPESAHGERVPTAASAGLFQLDRAAAVAQTKPCGIERIAKPRPDPVQRSFAETSALQSVFVRATNTLSHEAAQFAHAVSALARPCALDRTANTAHSESGHVAHAATAPPSGPCDVEHPASIPRFEPGHWARACMSPSAAQAGVAHAATAPQFQSAHAACTTTRISAEPAANTSSESAPAPCTRIAEPVDSVDVVRADTASRSEPARAVHVAAAVSVTESSDLSCAAASADSKPSLGVHDTQAPPELDCNARAVGQAGEWAARPWASDEHNGNMLAIGSPIDGADDVLTWPPSTQASLEPRASAARSQAAVGAKQVTHQAQPNPQPLFPPAPAPAGLHSATGPIVIDDPTPKRASQVMDAGRTPLWPVSEPRETKKGPKARWEAAERQLSNLLSSVASGAMSDIFEVRHQLNSVAQTLPWSNVVRAMKECFTNERCPIGQRTSKEDLSEKRRLTVMQAFELLCHADQVQANVASGAFQRAGQVEFVRPVVYHLFGIRVSARERDVYWKLFQDGHLQRMVTEEERSRLRSEWWPVPAAGSLPLPELSPTESISPFEDEANTSTEEEQTDIQEKECSRSDSSKAVLPGQALAKESSTLQHRTYVPSQSCVSKPDPIPAKALPMLPHRTHAPSRSCLRKLGARSKSASVTFVALPQPWTSQRASLRAEEERAQQHNRSCADAGSANMASTQIFGQPPPMPQSEQSLTAMGGQQAEAAKKITQLSWQDIVSHAVKDLPALLELFSVVTFAGGAQEAMKCGVRCNELGVVRAVRSLDCTFDVAFANGARAWIPQDQLQAVTVPVDSPRGSSAWLVKESAKWPGRSYAVSPTDPSPPIWLAEPLPPGCSLSASPNDLANQPRTPAEVLRTVPRTPAELLLGAEFARREAAARSSQSRCPFAPTLVDLDIEDPETSGGQSVAAGANATPLPQAPAAQSRIPQSPPAPAPEHASEARIPVSPRYHSSDRQSMWTVQELDVGKKLHLWPLCVCA